MSAPNAKSAVAHIPDKRIVDRILTLRGQRVMLDEDIAELYGVPTKRLNEQVKRNRDRFPEDFMFQLSPEEVKVLRSQIATSKPGSGGRRYLPTVFTDYGILMLSSVLKSEQAIQMNILIIRAFVYLREMMAEHRDLREKIEEMESKYDKNFAVVFEAIKRLLEDKAKPKPQIGFGRRAV